MTKNFLKMSLTLVYDDPSVKEKRCEFIGKENNKSPKTGAYEMKSEATIYHDNAEQEDLFLKQDSSSVFELHISSEKSSEFKKKRSKKKRNKRSYSEIENYDQKTSFTSHDTEYLNEVPNSNQRKTIDKDKSSKNIFQRPEKSSSINSLQIKSKLDASDLHSQHDIREIHSNSKLLDNHMNKDSYRTENEQFLSVSSFRQIPRKLPSRCNAIEKGQSVSIGFNFSIR